MVRYDSFEVFPQFTRPWLPRMRPSICGLSPAILPTLRPRSKPGRCQGIQPMRSPKHSWVSRSPFFAAAMAMMASQCMWSTWRWGMKQWGGVSMEVARVFRLKKQCGKREGISSSCSFPR